MSKIDLAVFDIDGTLVNWIDYAAKAYPAMRDALYNATKVSRKAITEAMQLYYTRAETMESSWLIQDLIRQGLFNKKDEKILIQACQKAFHSTREQSLSLFDGILELLTELKRRQIKLVLLTDAPACHAASRIKHVGLDQGYFETMYAMRDSLANEVPEEFYSHYDSGHYHLPFPITHLDEEKPKTQLEELLNMSSDEIKNRVMIIGDNYKKDMQVAKQHCCLGIHANWGKIDPEYIKIIQEFSGEEIMRRNSSQSIPTKYSSKIVSASHPMRILEFLEK